jgi:hypothetical protein
MADAVIQTHEEEVEDDLDNGNVESDVRTDTKTDTEDNNQPQWKSKSFKNFLRDNKKIVAVSGGVVAAGGVTSGLLAAGLPVLIGATAGGVVIIIVPIAMFIAIKKYSTKKIKLRKIAKDINHRKAIRRMFNSIQTPLLKPNTRAIEATKDEMPFIKNNVDFNLDDSNINNKMSLG